MGEATIDARNQVLSIPASRLKLLVLTLLAIAPFYVNGLYLPQLVEQPQWFWPHEVALWVVWPAAVLIVARKQGWLEWTSLGLTRPTYPYAPPVVGLVTLLAVISCLSIDERMLAFAQNLTAGWSVNQPTPFSYEVVVPPPGPQTGLYRLLALAFLSFSAAFVEELLYRGMLRAALPQGMLGWVLLLVASPLLFAGAHWEGGVDKLVYTFMWGVVFAAQFAATRSLWPNIAAHVIVDWHWLS